MLTRNKWTVSKCTCYNTCNEYILCTQSEKSELGCWRRKSCTQVPALRNTLLSTYGTRGQSSLTKISTISCYSPLRYNPIQVPGTYQISTKAGVHFMWSVLWYKGRELKEGIVEIFMIKWILDGMLQSSIHRDIIWKKKKIRKERFIGCRIRCTV